MIREIVYVNKYDTLQYNTATKHMIIWVLMCNDTSHAISSQVKPAGPFCQCQSVQSKEHGTRWPPELRHDHAEKFTDAS